MGVVPLRTRRLLEFQAEPRGVHCQRSLEGVELLALDLLVEHGSCTHDVGNGCIVQEDSGQAETVAPNIQSVLSASGGAVWPLT